MAYDPYRYESNSGYVPGPNNRADEIVAPDTDRPRPRGMADRPPPGVRQQPTSTVRNSDGSATHNYGAPTVQAAPPSAATGPVAQTGTMGGDVPLDPSGGGIGRYITQLMGNPDPYEREVYRADMARGIRGIDDSYNQQKTGIDEEMARRGIFDSTIAGGRLHDLNIGRRGAAMDLQERLATNRARDYAGNAQAAGNMGLGWGNLGLNQFGAQNNFLLALLSALGQGDFVGG